MARIMAMLSHENKAKILKSPLGVELYVPIVAGLLKESEAGARAYACETLHNICKKNSVVFVHDGRGSEQKARKLDGEMRREPFLWVAWNCSWGLFYSWSGF